MGSLIQAGGRSDTIHPTGARESRAGRIGADSISPEDPVRTRTRAESPGVTGKSQGRIELHHIGKLHFHYTSGGRGIPWIGVKSGSPSLSGCGPPDSVPGRSPSSWVG